MVEKKKEGKWEKERCSGQREDSEEERVRKLEKIENRKWKRVGGREIEKEREIKWVRGG